MYYFCSMILNNIVLIKKLNVMQTFSKSPLFTMNNIHYLCSESKELLFLLDYQFEESTPENISDNLPTEIQNQIRDLGDSYYTIAIIPHEKFQTLQLS